MTPEATLAALRRRGVAAELAGAAPERPEAGAPGAQPPPGADLVCSIEASQLVDALHTARDELGFDLLSAVTATDEGDHFRLIYHLVRTRRAPEDTLGFLVLRLDAQRTDHPDGPAVPSAVGVYPGANLQEREIFDLMGLRFTGHPSLTRVLTWPGFSGHPLRKDYVPVDEEIPWRLAGLKGPDGSLLDDAAAARAEEDAAWEPMAPNLPVSPVPGDAPAPR